jgi:hypothetical protein
MFGGIFNIGRRGGGEMTNVSSSQANDDDCEQSSNLLRDMSK